MYIRSREVRSLISKIRGGTDRLRVEEGRWSRIERSEHLCQHCESQEVEDSSPVPLNQNWLAFIYTLMYVHAWAL